MLRIIKVAAISAATLITPAAALIATGTPAHAAVSYDATNDGVITGHIDKGDVQPVLQWNDQDVQNRPVNFSTTFTTTTDTSWLIADGTRVHNLKTLTFKQGLAKETVFKSNGKIGGWDLTGLGGLEYVKQEVTGPAIYSGFVGGLNVAQSHDFGDELLVNGVLLPETPVAIPTV